MCRRARSLNARLAGAVLGGLAPLLVVAPALAQTAGVTHQAGGVAGYGAWDWFGLVFRMTAVLLVIWGSVVAMRWYVRRMNGEAGGGITRALQIVETRPLGPNRALHLVRIGDRAVLIGATPERINALMEIDDPAQLERLFAGGDEPARRGVPALIGGLSMLPALMSRAREAMAARTATPPLARTPGAPRVAPQPAGFLTDALARLGRRMRGAPKPAVAAAQPRAGIFSALAPSVPAARAAFDAAIEGRASRPAGSLFDRTLADAERVQGIRGAGLPFDRVPDFAPAFALNAAGSDPASPADPAIRAAGLRARTGYQATSADDALAREERISELQRAIIVARRNAG